MPAARDGAHPHLLLLHEAVEIRSLLRELFEEEGYQVTTAEATRDPAHFRALRPDVVVKGLSFAQTPDREADFLTTLDGETAPRRTPLVLCTTAGADAAYAMAAELDPLGVRVVRMPFDLDELLGVVAAALSQNEDR